ncbi:hypothetical protein GQ53DRAFT_891149 [Thozetella sp. PMI_491]|nr:hypothetical protein GQ53DRAFT_891149 [Thozetella sp. PMI_491]
MARPEDLDGQERPAHHGHDEASIDEPIDGVRAALRAESIDDPNGIFTEAPDLPFRLGFVDIVCLVVNQMIGHGIFMAPQTIMLGIDSTGAALLLWLAGIVYSLAGIHVYIEYGLNVPRYARDDGTERAFPRSGGALHYLQYVYRWFGYRHDVVLPITCIFGIAFIAFGNVAGNALSFAIWALRAANVEQTNAAVRGLAVGVAAFTCVIHAFSRRGGIVVNDICAVAKAAILLLIIITAIVVWAGGFPQTENVIGPNTTPAVSFANASQSPYGYAQAFLNIIFSFSGFEQPNYVLGEIRRPRKQYPLAMITGVGLVSVLYMLTNVAYMVVVPKDQQATNIVVQRFFELTFGRLSHDDNRGYRVFSSFIAISCLGNIIVTTYTAARVKQEIAKQGILPMAKTLAQNYDVSVGRVLAWLKSRGWLTSSFGRKWFNPEQHSEKTPVAAISLHFTACVILVLATWGMDPMVAYELLTGIDAWLFNGLFGILLALGILILHVRPPPCPPGAEGSRTRTWAEMTGPGFKKSISIMAATIYLVFNAFPIVVMWIPPTAAFVSALAWYLVPLVSSLTLGIGAAWFLGFLVISKWREWRHCQVYYVTKKPEFETADGVEVDPNSIDDSTDVILSHETVYLAWRAREATEKSEPVKRYMDRNIASYSPPPDTWTSSFGDRHFSDSFQQMDNRHMGRPHQRPSGFPAPTHWPTVNSNHV